MGGGAIETLPSTSRALTKSRSYCASERWSAPETGAPRWRNRLLAKRSHLVARRRPRCTEGAVSYGLPRDRRICPIRPVQSRMTRRRIRQLRECDVGRISHVEAHADRVRGDEYPPAGLVHRDLPHCCVLGPERAKTTCRAAALGAHTLPCRRLRRPDNSTAAAPASGA